MANVAKFVTVNNDKQRSMKQDTTKFNDRIGKSNVGVLFSRESITDAIQSIDSESIEEGWANELRVILELGLERMKRRPAMLLLTKILSTLGLLQVKLKEILSYKKTLQL